MTQKLSTIKIQKAGDKTYKDMGMLENSLGIILDEFWPGFQPRKCFLIQFQVFSKMINTSSRL